MRNRRGEGQMKCYPYKKGGTSLSHVEGGGGGGGPQQVLNSFNIGA